MSTRAAILATALLCAATPAVAQDANATFAGPRVEGLLGYENQQGPYRGDAGNSDGIVYGVALGYDVRRADLVFGGDVELSDASTDTRGDGIYASGDRVVIDSGRDLYVGGRLGVVVSPRALAYAKLGYTHANADIRYSGNTTPAAFTTDGDSDGVRVGAGAEVAAGGRTYFKAEYRYSDYGSEAIEHRHQFVAGVGFRF